MKLQELQKQYNLELDRVIGEIKKQKPKSTLIQFPDGLKPYALEITDYLEKNTNTEISIWLDSCFGACDLPTHSDADLIVQFGHASW